MTIPNQNNNQESIINVEQSNYQKAVDSLYDFLKEVSTDLKETLTLLKNRPQVKHGQPQ